MSQTPKAAPVSPIRSSEDHERAKTRIEMLIQVAGEGDEALHDELDVLFTLVEAYERDRFPLEAPSAIEAIRFRMQQRDLTQKDLEPFIGSRARVSEVLSGKRKLSPDMMRALHEGLGVPYEALMQKPKPSDLDTLEAKRPVLSRLRKLGFEIDGDAVGDFVRAAFGATRAPALNKRTRTQRASGKTDPAALVLWQAAVLHEARRRDAVPFDPSRLTDDLLRDVARCSVEPDGPRQAIELLASHGITVVVVEVLPGTFLDGGAMLLDGERPVIGLTLRHDRIDGFWFTLLHELSHIQQHFEVLQSSGEAFLDELDLSSEDELERQADDGAARALIPTSLAGPLGNTYASTEDVLSVAETAGVHAAIVAGRWQHDHGNYKKFSRLIERNTLRPMLTGDTNS